MSAEESRPQPTKPGRPQQHHPHDVLSVAQPVQPCGEKRTVAFDIPAPLIRFNGDFYTMVVTAEEARDAAWTLLSMAADADRAAQARATLEKALALEAAGISVIPLDADGNPAIDNWEEYQHRRATRDEILAWFGPGSTSGAGGG